MARFPDEPSTPPGAQQALAQTDSTEVDLTEVDLEEVLRPRGSSRTRAAQVGAVLTAVLVIVGLLLHSIHPPQQQGTAALLSNPSPAPMPPSVIIASNVNFGTLTVNGQLLKDPPPVVTRLVHQGMNVVTLSAPPFGQHTCRFWYSSYPVSSSYQLSSDTPCSGSSSVDGAFAVRGISVVPALILDIELSGTDLPSNLATRAFEAASQAVAAVQPQTVVPAGQYYATGHDAQGRISSRRATAPLHAQLRFAPGDCGTTQFCPIPLDPRLAFAPGQRIWSVGLLLTARWRFTPPAGPAVLSPTVPLAMPLQLFLAEDAADGWNVLTLPPFAATVLGSAALPLADQVRAAQCQVGVDYLAGLMQTQDLSRYSVSTPSNRGVEGCAIQLLQGSSSATTIWGRFLWRFGVLLAVDKSAHTLTPWLPIAPQDEIAAVEG